MAVLILSRLITLTIFLIDCRLNIFRNDNGQWCIVSKVFAFQSRGDSISLTMETFGNCFLQYQDNVSAIDRNSFEEMINDGMSLLPDAKYWLIRGKKVNLSHNKQDYKEAGINLREYEPGEIYPDEVARLLILKHQNLFRATNEELYKMVPKDLTKILILDEWFHQEHESWNWEETMPGSNETWQQIAKVIVTGDASFYKPTIAPNTHWKFWPESGSM